MPNLASIGDGQTAVRCQTCGEPLKAYIQIHNFSALLLYDELTGEIVARKDDVDENVSFYVGSSLSDTHSCYECGQLHRINRSTRDIEAIR